MIFFPPSAVPRMNAESIVAKMDIVRNYMQESFGIDPDKLRSSTILRREKDVTMGRVNLKDLSLR